MEDSRNRTEFRKGMVLEQTWSSWIHSTRHHTRWTRIEVLRHPYTSWSTSWTGSTWIPWGHEGCLVGIHHLTMRWSSWRLRMRGRLGHGLRRRGSHVRVLKHLVLIISTSSNPTDSETYRKGSRDPLDRQEYHHWVAFDPMDWVR